MSAGEDAREQKVRPYVRLTINVRTGTMRTIEQKAAERETSLTDVVHRAVRVLDFLEAEIARGNQIAIVKPNGDIGEIKLL